MGTSWGAWVGLIVGLASTAGCSSSSSGGSESDASSADATGGGDAAGEAAGDVASDAGGSGEGGGSTLDAPSGDAAADGGDPNAVAWSGTRLRATWRVSADGVKDFVGWHDSMRNEDCTFFNASDGVLRCLPVNSPVASGWADSACTQRAYVSQPQVDPCVQVPSYVLGYSNSAGSCSASGLSVLPVGAKTTQTSYYVGSGGPTNCTAVALASGESVYGTGTAVPATSFVSAVTQSISGSTRLGGDYYVAEDGARQQIGFYDSQTHGLCGPQIASDGTQRCLPQPQTFEVAAIYANSSCTQRVAQFSAACSDAGPGAYVLRGEYPDGGTCNPFERTFAVGAALDAGSLFTPVASAPDAGCQPATSTSPSLTYVAEGTEQPPSTFVAIPTAALGTGRLVLNSFTPAATDGHAWTLGDAWHDTILGVDCHFAAAADGMQRCIPVGAQVFYSDTGCTQKVAASYDNCLPTFPKYAVVVDLTCPVKSHVYPVGAAVSAAQAYTPITSGCTTTTVATALYSLGGEVAASSLATATLVTE